MTELGRISANTNFYNNRTNQTNHLPDKKITYIAPQTDTVSRGTCGSVENQQPEKEEMSEEVRAFWRRGDAIIKKSRENLKKFMSEVEKSTPENPKIIIKDGEAYKVFPNGYSVLGLPLVRYEKVEPEKTGFSFWNLFKFFKK